MKNLIYLYFISALVFASCDDAISIEEEIITPPEEVIPDPIPDEKNTPKDYDFQSTQANDTLNIAYSHDLGGQTINLASNVLINYNGGELINGTLVFQEGKIDGKLLNQKLKIHGNKPLKSSTFVFDKSKWNIVEGEVSNEVALTNAETLEKLFADVKSYGADVFQIDDLDAYFQITNEKNLINGRDAAISVPSDFSLEMTNNTHLRVQANRYAKYQLLSILGVSNVSISGGNLYGDRDTHDYTPITTVTGHTYTAHEWGHLISIETGINIKIDNVHLSHAAGDGIDIHSLKFAFDPNYVGSNNITITNCVFNSNRRNNLSITDGYNMLVENNTFLNAGVDTQNSKGIAPGFSIDVEAQRSRDANGDLKYYQLAKDITIRNNTESGSKVGAFTVAIGMDVLIENNTVEGSIGFTFASGVKIKGNRITSARTAAITAGKPVETNTVFNNEISGNIISDASLGIILYNQSVKVFDNEITNCKTGITMKNLKNAEIYNNTIQGNVANAYGIYTHISTADDVTIRNNNINIPYKPIAFVNVNLESGQENNTVTVLDNNLNGGKVSISNSNGIIVE
jgi:hypothetical protein